MKLFKLDDGTPSIANQVKREFNSSQLDYYINELTRSAMDSTHTVNDKNAPQDVDPGKINLSNITLKEVVGTDLSVLNFKSDDTTVDDLIKYSRETLQEGDINFKKKDYDSSLKDYESILRGISRLALDKQTAVKKYKDEIVKRIDNCYIKIYNKSLAEIDPKVKAETSATPKKITEFAKSYEAILLDYQGRTKALNIPTNPTIESVMVDRLEKLDIANSGYEEKKGDLLYENYKFSQAKQIYKKIYYTIRSRPQTKVYKEYSTKLLSKINAVTETGTSFVDNRVRAYCNAAEKKNFQSQLAFDKGRTFEAIAADEEVQDSMLDARKTLQKSEFASEQLFAFYNDTVERLNKDKKNPVAKSIEKVHIEFEDSGEVTKGMAISRSILFPGYGQISERPDKLKSKLIYYSGFASLAALTVSTVNFYSAQRKYDREQGTDPALFAVVSQQNAPLLGLSFINSDYEKFTPLRENLRRAENYLNTSIALYAGIYIYSLVDILFFTNRTEILGIKEMNDRILAKSNENGFGFKMARTPTSMPTANSGFEQNYIFSYSHHW